MKIALRSLAVYVSIFTWGTVIAAPPPGIPVAPAFVPPPTLTPTLRTLPGVSTQLPAGFTPASGFKARSINAAPAGISLKAGDLNLATTPEPTGNAPSAVGTTPPTLTPRAGSTAPSTTPPQTGFASQRGLSLPPSSSSSAGFTPPTGFRPPPGNFAPAATRPQPSEPVTFGVGPGTPPPRQPPASAFIPSLNSSDFTPPGLTVPPGFFAPAGPLRVGPG